MSAAITHGRHCICSACARQDWSEPGLACCGMHGPECPPLYAPLGAPGEPDPTFAGTCAKPGCKREPTVAHNVRPSFMRVASAEYGLDQRKVEIRHYEVCDAHDAEFFARDGWLTDKQSDRIRKELRCT